MQKERHSFSIILPTTMMTNAPTISEDEAAVYDRQIRLWGLEAQQRIQSARVLVVGVRALADEVTKNIVLAGIGAVCFMDHAAVTEADLGAQFFLSAEDVGKNRAETTAARATLLNPRVAVSAETRRVGDALDDFFGSFTVIVYLDDNLDDLIRLNEIARSRNILFYAANTAGYFGFAFADLNVHTYVEEKAVVKAKDAEPEIKREKKEERYLSMQACLGKRFAGVTGRALKKQISPLLIGFFGLYEFTRQSHRNPSSADELAPILREVEARHCVESGFVADEMARLLAQSAGAELSPVCAIVGGMLAQDLVKAISGKELPLSNFLVYNALENSAPVFRWEI